MNFREKSDALFSDFVVHHHAGSKHSDLYEDRHSKQEP